MARHGRPVGLLALGVGIALLAIPAAAFAGDVAPAGAAPLAPRANVLVAGPYAGRVAVSADVLHPADPAKRVDRVRIGVSRHGARLASGTDRIPRPVFTSVFATHTVLLDAGESRRVRSAARGGGHVRLTVTTTPGDGGAVQVATATVALATTSMPPLSSCYSNRENAAYVYLQGDAVNTAEFGAGGASEQWWMPSGGSTPITGALIPTATAAVVWSSGGSLYATPAFQNPTGSATLSGSFSADATSGSLVIPGGVAFPLGQCFP